MQSAKKYSCVQAYGFSAAGQVSSKPGCVSKEKWASNRRLRMDRSTVHRKSGLFDGFGECGVSVAAAGDIFAAGSEFHRDGGFVR